MAAKKKSASKKKSAPKKKTTLKKQKSSPKKKSTSLKKKFKALVKKTTALVTRTTRSAGPLTIITESLPDFIVGQAKKISIQASGGTPPYAFQLTQGTLPAGLNFNAKGTLYGTGTQPTDTTIFIKVTDSARPTKANLTQAYALRVDTP